MQSVRDFPPFGDFHGMETFGDGANPRPPVILQTTSGTTGQPQPLFFGPRSREIQNLLYVRALLLQGLRHDDIVHSLYGFGTVNAGHYTREAITHFTGALLLTASTGTVTPSRQQISMMKHFGATVLIGFADYIRKLAEVAREEGLEPGKNSTSKADLFQHRWRFARLYLQCLGWSARVRHLRCRRHGHHLRKIAGT